MALFQIMYHKYQYNGQAYELYKLEYKIENFKILKAVRA